MYTKNTKKRNIKLMNHGKTQKVPRPKKNRIIDIFLFSHGRSAKKFIPQSSYHSK
jgi:hypothetical protein